MKTLSIDVESFSSVDLTKCGAARYVESPDFTILLFAYSVDFGPVEVVDFACGETLPPDIYEALYDPAVEKTAYNAPFERTTIGKYFNRYCPPEQWDCTMVLASCCGLPLGLKAVGEALQLSEDKAKMKEGADLIRYFCLPCKPTKKNGGRTRNLPEHDPEAWAVFKAYNKRDVEVENTIRLKLLKWRPDRSEHKLWVVDQKINDKGMGVDIQLAENAIKIGEDYKARLLDRAAEISGLENPNSADQIKQWLRDQEGVEVASLNKKVIADVVAGLTQESAKEFMALRTEFSKSSVKKYEAITRSVAEDGHIHGCFQFAGAGRTGRWCLTGDHEVLTPNGWIRLDEWPGGQILCWSPSTEQLAFKRSDRVKFPYDGEMITYSTKRCQQVATPDHKMAVLDGSGSWTPKTLQEIGQHRVKIPFTGVGHTRRTVNPDQLRVLIMTQADGHYTETGAVRYHFVKKRKVERCKSLLRRCGVPFTEKAYDNRVVIQVPERVVPLWLRQFRNKTFGYWMIDESPDIIFDELPEWDGYRCGPNSIQYSTCNEQNADVIQACAVMAGYSATKLVKERDNNAWSTAYIVNIWLTPGRGTDIRGEQIGVLEYSGDVYCAVTETGYFAVRRNGVVWVSGNSGRLVQLQNLPQNHMEDLASARALVRDGDEESFELLYPNVQSALSELIRTALIPEEGHRFIVADYSAIEARVLAWMAGEQWRLDVFTNGGDIYCASASQMFKVPVEKHGQNSHLRQKGKVAELALGYGGGVGALKAFGADKMGMSEEDMAETVDLWRSASPHVVAMWKDLERAAIRCVVKKVPTISSIGHIRFDFEDGVLWMTLPSGRRIAYWGAAYVENNKGYKTLTYMGTDQKTKKWTRLETWGGKLVENCWAGDTRVLTDRGWVPIKDVTLSDRLWDGFEWVQHGVSKCQGVMPVVYIDGGTAVTPNHEVLTTKGWKKIEDCNGLHRAEVQLPYGCAPLALQGFSWKTPLDGALRMWKRIQHGYSRLEKANEAGQGNILRVSARKADIGRNKDARHESSSSVCGMEINARSLYKSKSQGLEELWSERNNSVQSLASQLRELLGRHGPFLCGRSRLGQEEQRRRLFPGKLSVGIKENELLEPKEVDMGGSKWREDNSPEALGVYRSGAFDFVLSLLSRLPFQPSVRPRGHYAEVYDIINAGPRHQYVVLTSGGPLLAHNCTQATARDCLKASLLALDRAGYDIRGHVHDEVIITEPVNGRTVEEVSDLMGQPIDWAPGLPLRADGYECEFYQKD